MSLLYTGLMTAALTLPDTNATLDATAEAENVYVSSGFEAGVRILDGLALEGEGLTQRETIELRRKILLLGSGRLGGFLYKSMISGKLEVPVPEVPFTSLLFVALDSPLSELEALNLTPDKESGEALFITGFSLATTVCMRLADDLDSLEAGEADSLINAIAHLNPDNCDLGVYQSILLG